MLAGLLPLCDVCAWQAAPQQLTMAGRSAACVTFMDGTLLRCCLPFTNTAQCLCRVTHQCLCRVTLVEAQELLGSFDGRLRQYAARKLTRAGVHLVQVGLAALCFGQTEWQKLLTANHDRRWRQDAACNMTPCTSPSGASGCGWLPADGLWQKRCQWTGNMLRCWAAPRATLPHAAAP